MFVVAFPIWRRDMLVLRRSLFSELLAVVAYPLTLYLAFGIGLKGYISDVEGMPYAHFHRAGPDLHDRRQRRLRRQLRGACGSIAGSSTPSRNTG